MILTHTVIYEAKKMTVGQLLDEFPKWWNHKFTLYDPKDGDIFDVFSDWGWISNQRRNKVLYLLENEMETITMKPIIMKEAK